MLYEFIPVNCKGRRIFMRLADKRDLVIVIVGDFVSILYPKFGCLLE